MKNIFGSEGIARFHNFCAVPLKLSLYFAKFGGLTQGFAIYLLTFAVIHGICFSVLSNSILAL